MPATIVEFRCSLMNAIDGGSPAPVRAQLRGRTLSARRSATSPRRAESRFACTADIPILETPALRAGRATPVIEVTKIDREPAVNARY